MALALLIVPASGPRGEAIAWGLPNRGQPNTPARAAGVGREAAAAGSPIQEVAPPPAVLQLSEALAERQPRVRIVEPADGALLPDGPWNLRLQVEDWPLVDAGDLGLGPHLLVQIDDAPPTPLLETSLSLPPLSPGSHRLTVMAARPWGEVVKRPGAFQQIRLNRIAANPLGLPAQGTPQLLATAPLQASQAEPVLLDWLLLDAPLQHLRADDARWRLRISVNGDSFLVDQATPLWLKGWRPGSNALLLELVDGQGEPLNPPFNSLVREIRLESQAPRPAWLGGRLGEADLAQLLGQQPAGNPALPAKVGVPDSGPGETPKSSSPVASDAGAESPPTQPGDAVGDLPEPASAPVLSEPRATESPQTEPLPPEPPMPTPLAPTPLVSESPVPAPSMPMGESSAPPEKAPEQTSVPEESPPDQATDTPSNQIPALEPRSPAPIAATAADPPPAGPTSGAAGITVPAEAAQPMAVAANPTAPARGIRPAARDEVNPDGTLIRPRGGLLQALRERLKR